MNPFRIVIAGRPNVGKSSLFNILVKSKNSVESDIPGTTRDPVKKLIFFENKAVEIIDSGGYEFNAKDEISKLVKQKALEYLKSADLILFMVDRHSIIEEDIQYYRFIKKLNIKNAVVVNKVEKKGDEYLDKDIYSLGAEKYILISAIHRRNIGDIYDFIEENLKGYDFTLKEDVNIKVAIVGRPNVGKSSLLNAIIEKERAIVSDIPGTTIDSLDEEIIYHDFRISFIDTAGIRRKKSIKTNIEYYSILRSFRAIDRADIVIHLVSPENILVRQDKKIADYVFKKGKSYIIVVNKVDLVKGKEKEIQNEIRYKFPHINFVKILFISALNKEGIDQLLEYIINLYKRLQIKWKTSTLNYFLENIKKKRQILIGNSYLNLFYCVVVSKYPLTIMIFVNKEPDKISNSYKDFIINNLRKEFDLESIPIKIIFKKRK